MTQVSVWVDPKWEHLYPVLAVQGQPEEQNVIKYHQQANQDRFAYSCLCNVMDVVKVSAGLVTGTVILRYNMCNCVLWHKKIIDIYKLSL